MKKALVTLILSLFGITALSAKCGINNPPKTCYVGGCSGQLCTAEQGAISTCEWRDEYACYADATCERQTNGQCGWTNTPELQECLANPPSADQCYVGGCSGELCTADQGAISNCLWRDEYVCYDNAICERQTNGECGWTNTPQLEECLANPPTEGPVDDRCYAGGCSGQLCTDDPNAISTCEWTAAYACYRDATCERQDNGQCGWTSTPDLQECLANPPGGDVIAEPDEPVDDRCYVGGCSGQLCTAEEGAISTCEWTPAYACYKDATCERQADGECGWTNTPQLKKCLAHPPSLV